MAATMRCLSCCFCALLFLLTLRSPRSTVGLTDDGLLLLSFKNTVVGDPLSVLAGWDPADDTPCSWNGVVCMGFPVDALSPNSTGGEDSFSSWVPGASRVISLVLRDSQLAGTIAPALGKIEHLRRLDLSGNAFNGTLPAALLYAGELRVLSLANNHISGELPDFSAGRFSSLRVLNLAGNAIAGRIPATLSLLPNLTAVLLSGNYLSGGLFAGGFAALQVLDLSSNSINGSLPAGGIGGLSLRLLNLSHNRLRGEIPPVLASKLPTVVKLDLSFNNLSGPVPQSPAFLSQMPAALAGNPGLCGRPLDAFCASMSTVTVSSPDLSPANPPESKSPPAFAAIPENVEGNSPTIPGSGRSRGSGENGNRGGIRIATILAIAGGDLVGLAVAFTVFLYVFHAKQRRRQQEQEQIAAAVVPKNVTKNGGDDSTATGGALSCCLRLQSGGGESSDSTDLSAYSSEIGTGDHENKKGETAANFGAQQPVAQQKLETGAVLVTVDGETELAMDTLLKASAYILGAVGSRIVYKAVLADGTALAVRRIGESCCISKLRDFESQVRAIAKLRHPNVLRLRGFYWSTDEKLLIHDFAANGSLAGLSLKKKDLNLEARLLIVRGVARGLAYLHDKKAAHGDVKPSNVLLGADFEPVIGDFGVDRFVRGDGGPKSAAAAGDRYARSLPEREKPFGGGGGGSTSEKPVAAYQAPEMVKQRKPSTKGDVYSFGMVLLEVFAGRVIGPVELCQWNNADDRGRILRMADPAMRGELEGKEDTLLACFKLGFACCAPAAHKRPSMKEALQILDRLPPLPLPLPAPAKSSAVL